MLLETKIIKFACQNILISMTNFQSTFLNIQQFKLTTYNADALVDTGRTNSYICKNFINQHNVNYQSIKFSTNMTNLSLKNQNLWCVII